MLKNIRIYLFILFSIMIISSCGNKIDENLVKTFDCEDLGLDIGDECELDWINLPAFVSPDCECLPDFDCPDILRDFGDDCMTEENEAGIINENCECEEVIINYDCPHNFQGNIGAPCTSDQGNPGTVILLTIPQGQYCECVGEDDVDCPFYEGNIGDSCDNGFGGGYLSESCDCLFPDFDDCEEISANIGDSCVVPDNGLSGIVNEDCECVAFDCQELEANIGDNCITNENQNGTVNADCECVE